MNNLSGLHTWGQLSFRDTVLLTGHLKFCVNRGKRLKPCHRAYCVTRLKAALLSISCSHKGKGRAVITACLIVVLTVIPGPVARASGGLALGPLNLGGAVRANISERSWLRQGSVGDHVDIDTIMLNARFTHGDWEGSAQYRFYPYPDSDYTTHFLHHGWVGYRLNKSDYIRAGVQKVPFGPLPFASHSYFFSVLYYLGLEDDYDAGFRYHTQRGRWNLDLAWFRQDEGSFSGRSNDSARYSYDIVSDLGTDNSERDHVAGRVACNLDHGQAGSGEIGLSVLYGALPNASTGRTGRRLGVSLHWVGDFGPWNIIAQGVYHDVKLENPAGEDNRLVVMGAYDFPYQVAAEVVVGSLGVARSWTMDTLGLETLTLYNNYSYMRKRERAFGDTHQNVLGVSLNFKGPALLYLDLLSGRNHAYAGPDYTNAFGAGIADTGWEHRLNLNVGFYF